jgi:hypothetical protein
MSDGPAETPPWGRLRWCASVLLIMLLHLGGLFALSDWGEVPPARTPDSFNVRLFAEPGEAHRLLETYSLNDPTLLAAVGPRGFSGPAWMNITPPPFKLPEWSDSERWLTQDISVLGADFRSYVRTNLGATLSIANQPSPPPIRPTGQARNPSPAASVFVAGNLASRPLLAQPELKPVPTTNLLLPTQVEVLVNDKGFVFSPRLHPAFGVRNEGQKAADREALKLIPQLQFAPLKRLPGNNDFPFTKGHVIFQWTSTPPPATTPPVKK